MATVSQIHLNDGGGSGDYFQLVTPQTFWHNASTYCVRAVLQNTSSPRDIYVFGASGTLNGYFRLGRGGTTNATRLRYNGSTGQAQWSEQLEADANFYEVIVTKDGSSHELTIRTISDDGIPGPIVYQNTATGTGSSTQLISFVGRANNFSDVRVTFRELECYTTASVDEANVAHRWDFKGTTDGASQVLDTVGGNHLNIMGTPTWSTYDDGTGGGVDPVTADGLITLPLLTLDALGSATVPQPDGNIDYTIPSLTVSASGSAVLPQPNGTANYTLPSIIVSGSGSSVLPQPSGDISVTLPSLTIDASGAASLPNPTGIIDYTLGSITVNGLASATLPQPDGSVSYSIPSLTVSGAGSATLSDATVDGNITLPSLTVSGSASATLPQPNGDVSYTLPTLTVSASGSATVTFPVGDISITLPSVSVSASGTVTLPQPSGIGSFDMPVLTVTGFATVSGLELIIEPGTNHKQQYLSNKVLQQYQSNKHIYH